jgi:hypothetical protein
VLKDKNFFVWWIRLVCVGVRDGIERERDLLDGAAETVPIAKRGRMAVIDFILAIGLRPCFVGCFGVLW